MNITTTELAEPAVSIIIPHCDDLVRLSRCLEALTTADVEDVEIVVVDNGSTVSLDDIRSSYPRVRFIEEAEPGAGRARNRGVRESRAPVLAFIDADCVPNDDWLAVARETIRENDVVGGRVDVFDETSPPRSGAEAFETVFAFRTQQYFQDKGFLPSGNLVVRRAAFETVGGFGSGVSEDVDWSLRATAAGYRLCYDDNLRVSHPTRRDWPSLQRKWRRTTQESYALKEPSLGTRVRWGGRAFAMPLSAVIHAPQALRSPALRSFPERARATLTLFRLRLSRMIWMLRQVAGRDL